MSLYHTFICAGVELSKRKSNEASRVAVLGLGGGGLCMFLRKCYEDVKITAVDIDPEMLNVAKEYFQLVTDDRLEVQIKDGMDFLKYEADAGMLWIPKVLGKFYEKKKHANKAADGTRTRTLRYLGGCTDHYATAAL
ncbi:unnamed protein product [Chilo suppressalis]|uniref:PABS domain-containing protein n=1 Tax=Chilo suppressalis TaxID=168631 RepID=A0ABN8B709_CHISP|nr:unnamed protein product [Chilo suppressalis]